LDGAAVTVRLDRKALSPSLLQAMARGPRAKHAAAVRPRGRAITSF
jgi:hypothetical protein